MFRCGRRWPAERSTPAWVNWAGRAGSQERIKMELIFLISNEFRFLARLGEILQ
jgi:hypothetical protein